ncbi:hypothetical protein G4G27_08805 [Sphingomonas sp. So64.6b]|uniref:hypothetical protein n=1 Tax=Sphingomonas sp. So64.6b TaxID=2997354 RepID=UPI001604734C|nr:hypothetical protein [Sphingomonas sp. So64.6b]QNA84076.1 hypothetical protein G4G27_08805 [Sphingomonas sp. So64.6b]
MNQTLTGIAAAAPAIAMIGFFACLIGGGYLLVTGRQRKRGALLLVMAVVLLGNVFVWTM